MNPGAMFLGNMNTNEQKFLVELIKNAKHSGYTRLVEPCAGTFSMSNLAVQSGFSADEIEASDISLAPVIAGYAISGKPLKELKIRADGFSDEELEDYATALYAITFLKISKNAGSEYYFSILRDMEERREEHIASINRQIDSLKSELKGLKFKACDMWKHIEEVKDDPHTIVIVNPQTYFGETERFYDTRDILKWNEPDKGEFNPEEGYADLYDMMSDAKALFLCYQEKKDTEISGNTIFARAGSKPGTAFYITTNREEEAVALANGKKIKRPQESKLEPLNCSIIPLDHVITETSKIQIIKIPASTAQYYRMLWTHNFVGSSATWNMAVLIDGYIASVFGISKMEINKNADDKIFVWYVMKAPHKIYRLGRLCYMLSRNKGFIEMFLDTYEKSKIHKLCTTMLTRYPENKEVRGIMKLTNRVPEKENGYKLTYECELSEQRQTEEEVLTEGLKKEKQWQKKR